MERHAFIATDGTVRLGEWIRLNYLKPAVEGADINLVLPGGWWHRLRTVQASLDPSVAVGNRFIRWQLFDGNHTVYQTCSNVAQTSNNPSEYSLSTSTGFIQGAFSDINLPMPDLWLPPGAAIVTNTLGLDIHDQWVALRICAERTTDDILKQYLGSRVYKMLDYLHSTTPQG